MQTIKQQLTDAQLYQIMKNSGDCLSFNQAAQVLHRHHCLAYQVSQDGSKGWSNLFKRAQEQDTWHDPKRYSRAFCTGEQHGLIFNKPQRKAVANFMDSWNDIPQE